MWRWSTQVVDACCGEPGACGGLKTTLAMQAHMLCVAPSNACDSDGRLTHLSLASERLRCSFPAALKALTQLQRLDLTFNDISGRCCPN
jgi:hypothetical protein